MTAEPEPGVTGWMQVLERIQNTLGGSLEGSQEAPASPPPEMPAAVTELLQTLKDHLAQLQSCLETAEQNATEVDRLLNEEANALQQWLEKLKPAQQKLLAWEQQAQ